jgi:hypothetical protein
LRSAWKTVALGLSIVALSCAQPAQPAHEAQRLPLAPAAAAPGPSQVATASYEQNEIDIANGKLALTWKLTAHSLKPARFLNRLTGQSTSLGDEIFRLTLEGGSLPASKMMAGTPLVETIPADPLAIQAAAHHPGKRITVNFQDGTGNVHAVWRAIGRDGANYLRQELTLQVTKNAIPLRSVMLLELPLRFPYNPGSVAGSPVVGGDVFCGLEHPMANNEVDGDVRCSLDRTVDLEPGQLLTVSSVLGVVRPGQLRRDFLAYIEQERARPYQPFLHYNSWYDIGYFSPFNQADALGAINAFGTELAEKRGVKLDSFLFDDGWDNHQSLWGFNSGFPNGFTPLKDAAARYGAAPGVWLSPWGGYGGPRTQRLKYGKPLGYETNADGFALSGPKYYQRFHQVCADFVTKYGINQFKFDGTGNATGQYPGSRFGSDFEAAIQIIEDLKATGTWPSPFWLRYADSIWRGGEDHTFTGPGSYRQRWITYRDGDTYRGIVQAGGTLYPLNSLMLHGLVFARSAKHLNNDPGNDFPDEVHTYFVSGTQLQEMYITPALLSAQNWDTIAEAAKWSRANSNTLMDSHWIGGNPFKGEIYGWASWSMEKGILLMRNPSNQRGRFVLDIGAAFELPPQAAKIYEGQSPWKSEAALPSVVLTAGQPRTFDLAPFQVLTLELKPVAK